MGLPAPAADVGGGEKKRGPAKKIQRESLTEVHKKKKQRG